MMMMMMMMMMMIMMMMMMMMMMMWCGVSLLLQGFTSPVVMLEVGVAREAKNS
jgi:hypothetical protein